MKTRIYIDTSVIGGYFDDEFRSTTRKLFEQLEEGLFIFVRSDLLEVELLPAPKRVRTLLDAFPDYCFEYVQSSAESFSLARTYIAEQVVGKSSLEDCQHIALATLSNVNVLASWNFKHIVNYNRIRGYNAVNFKYGHSLLEIRSPLELVENEEE